MSAPTPRTPWFTILEQITGTVLVLVLLSLGWMIGAVILPEFASWYSTEIEVLIVVGLLILALALVSVVALVQTRSGSGSKWQP